MELVDVFPDLCSHAKPKEMVTHQVKHLLKAEMANLIVAPSQGGLHMHGQQD